MIDSCRWEELWTHLWKKNAGTRAQEHCLIAKCSKVPMVCGVRMSLTHNPPVLSRTSTEGRKTCISINSR